jgi:NTE family protein
MIRRADVVCSHTRRRKPDVPIALALSGGGAKGDFQVGALKYLHERGIRPDIITATSVGSINAVKLAEGDDGFEGLEAIWHDLRNNEDMYREEPWFAHVDDAVKWLFQKSLGAAGAFVAGRAPLYALFPPLLIADAVKAGIDLGVLAQSVGQMLDARSIYNLNPIEEKLRDPGQLDPDKIGRSGITLRLGAVGLKSGALRYFNEEGRLFDSEGAPLNGAADLCDAVLASASIPCIFPPRELGGETYVDGGVREILPIQAAVDLGADTIYAITVSPPLKQAEEPFADAKIVSIGERAVLDIMCDETLRNEVSPPRGWGVRVISIRPTIDIHDILTIDPGLIRISMAYGYMVAADAIAGRRRERLVADEITTSRMKIWDLEHDAHGKRRQLEPPGALVPVPDHEVVMEIRQRKRELREAVIKRTQRGGPVPPDANTWWLEWEKHTWEPLTGNPWEPFGADPRGRAEGEQPPSADVPPVKVVDISWLVPTLL